MTHNLYMLIFLCSNVLKTCLVQIKSDAYVIILSSLYFSDDSEGKVKYSIIGGNGTRFFELDENTGVISLRNLVRGQQGRVYQLLVRATDEGVPQLSSTVSLSIYIEEVNYNSPRFLDNQAFQVSWIMMHNELDKMCHNFYQYFICFKKCYVLSVL